MKKKTEKVLVILLLIGIVCASIGTFTGCTDTDKDTVEILNLETLDYIEEIQASGDLTFEWLRTYNATRPTLILFHGEWLDNSANDFTMSLDTSEYTSYNATTNPTNYAVQKNISGYLSNGLNTELGNYWLTVAQYNVAIFHWESFADDDTGSISSKFYTVPKMRYRKADGTYETANVPKAGLASIVASLYIKEMAGKINNKEIRFVGNGIGANLALSVSDLLTTYYQSDLLDSNYLPGRLALCDPYLSADDMYLDIAWDTNIDTSNGTMSMINSMLTKVTNFGTVVEMIESKEMSSYTAEVVDEDGVTSTVELYNEIYAYDVDRKNATVESIFNDILSKVAYLEMAESYSLKFSDKYIAYKRIALDWYLYSIIGSDDTAVGYPTLETSTSSTCNWGTRSTRPILNDRQSTNDASTSSTASNKGKNYGISAWTPTVYTRALKGISFTLKKKSSSATSNIHDNMTYNYSNYIMDYFRSENYQKSNQTNYTLICGYIYIDTNEDSYINDGVLSGVANAKITFDLKEKDKTKSTANFDVVTDSTGFYVIRLNDKTVDTNGDESESGYKFDIDYTVTLTYLISSPKYVYQATAASGLFYETLGGQNYSSSACTFTLNYYYADAITIRNCLIIPETVEE